MAVLARHALGHGNALLLGLVRQHRPAHHVTHRPDAGQIAAAVAIDHNRATLVELQANRIRVEAHGVGHAANRDDQLVNVERLRLALGIGPGHADALLGDLDRTNGDAEFDLQTLLDESLVRFLGDLLIHRSEKLRQRFQDRDLGAQATPDRTHLQTDHARADQAELFRQRTDAQRAVIREHLLFIEGCTGQGPRGGAGGQHDLLAHQRFLSRAADLDLVAAVDRFHKRATTMKKADLVFLEQVQDAVVVLLDDTVLARDHLRHVHAHVGDGDAVLGEVVIGLVKMFGRLQQRLARNAADVGASAARRWAARAVLPLVDTRHAHAQLCRPNGSDIAAGTGTDDDHIKLLAHDFLNRFRS